MWLQVIVGPCPGSCSRHGDLELLAGGAVLEVGQLEKRPLMLAWLQILEQSGEGQVQHV